MHQLEGECWRELCKYARMGSKYSRMESMLIWKEMSVL
jgi:hypothetical protein